MLPILATTAASAASDIIFNIADRFAKGTAKTAPAAPPAIAFSTLVDQASFARHAQDLSTKLGRSAEVATAANAAGATGPLHLVIEANGDTALRLPDGGLKPVQLSEELRGAARELHQLRQPTATGATRVGPSSTVTISVA